MKAFVAKYLFLIIWIAAIVAIGALFVWVYQLNTHLTPLATNPPPNSAVNTPPPPPPPPAPSISLTMTKNKNKNTLTINWANLPGDTVALRIYRGKKGTATSTWQLWKTVDIPFGQLSGSAQFDPGTGTYSYYIEAVSGSGNGTSTGSGNGDIVWHSGVTDPGTGTPSSTPQNPPAPTSTDNGQNNSSGTVQNPPPSPPPAPTSTGNPGNTPTGTPYYNPQIQISGYGSGQNGNFWVQHVDQKIQMGWQNLPPDTTSIVIYRSPNQDGPWATVLAQNNPGVNGSYSIQVVDDTLGSPYYYEMNAVAGSSTIATYGPIYLAGQ